MTKQGSLMIGALTVSIAASFLFAQGPPNAGPGGRGGSGAAGRGGGRGPARGGFTQFTRPLASAEVLARGKAVYETNCASCHAADLRGVPPKGHSLLHSIIALDDKHGELVSDALTQHTEPIALQGGDPVAVAEYLHSILATASGQGSPPNRPDGSNLNILVGDAKAGQAYFAKACASCHSITGDLKGIGAKYADDARGLQSAWVAGTAGGGFGRGGGNPVTVTMANGEKFTGKLVRNDDFLVVLTLADGTRKSIGRSNGIPKVDITDPQAAHKKMALAMDDPENKNMHDVTAYLATVK